MTLRQIDNKDIDLTDDEWAMYQKICSSYDTTTYKGSTMFKGLFEVNNNGLIVFLKPPTESHTSLEALFFIQNIYHHQHLRVLYGRVNEAIFALKEKEKELDEKLKVLDEKLKRMP